jgi:putative DNA primase/helicase
VTLAHHLQVALATVPIAPVFPCLPDKKPATKHGFKDATKDLERIRHWWTQHPEHLVGFPTLGLVIIDLDTSADPAVDQRAAWTSWLGLAEPNGWSVEDCPLVATPSDGLHVYFKANGTAVRNSASKLAPLIDVRGDGGYVIAAGSTLPDGRRYERLEGSGSKLPTAPRWLTDAITARTHSRPAATATQAPADPQGTRYGLTGLDAELGRLATAAVGERNDQLCRSAFSAGQLAAGGQLDPVYAARRLFDVATRIGLNESEAHSTIRSGMTAGAQRPRAANGR